MKLSRLVLISLLGLAVAACTPPVQKVDKYAIDCSQIRGFNYTPTGLVPSARGQYNEDDVCFQLDLAQGLNLNQCRVFVNFPRNATQSTYDSLANNLHHFAAELNKRGMGMMPVVGAGPWVRDESLVDQAPAWVEFLTNTLKDEPNLVMWDIMNEPDYNRAMIIPQLENCKLMSKLFKEMDPDTPLTIGMEIVEFMIQMNDYVDILQFHNYSETRDMIRDTIARAKAFAEKVGKPVFNGEICCIARANPYDVALEEHMKAGMGWYFWELMINKGGWGNVHGVFYQDGTVRDPSIPMAILGIFRNRSEEAFLEVPDREDKIGSVLSRIDDWKKAGSKDFETGIHLAEVCANVLESAQLAPMHESPNWKVNQIRESKDINELKAVIDDFYKTLKPYKKTK